MKLAAGQWVLHGGKSMWGPGRVEAVSEFLTVRFPEYKNGWALRFKSTAHPLVLDSDQVNTEAAQHLAAILTPPARTQAAKTKPGKLPKVVVSADSLIERFLKLFPEGFRGDKYMTEERNYKLEAARTCRDALAISVVQALLDAGDRPALVARWRQSIGKIVNLLAHRVPSAQFSAAVAREDMIMEIATGFVLLVGKEGGDVTPFYRALDAAVSPRLTWPFATLLPALWDPSYHVFVQPDAFRRAMASIGHDEVLKSAPDKDGYLLVRKVARKWLERLEPLGAVDFLDVQSFINRTKPPGVSAAAETAPALDDD